MEGPAPSESALTTTWRVVSVDPVNHELVVEKPERPAVDATFRITQSPSIRPLGRNHAFLFRAEVLKCT